MLSLTFLTSFTWLTHYVRFTLFICIRDHFVHFLIIKVSEYMNYICNEMNVVNVSTKWSECVNVKKPKFYY